MTTLTHLIVTALVFLASLSTRAAEPPLERHYLYVAEPGIRNDMQYGGHGLLVFDIDNGHKFVKRIPTGGGVDGKGVPLNVKGVAPAPSPGAFTSVLSKRSSASI